ncbi:Translation initiation factor 2 subunit alpha [uncultured archaeon]|nr:Translation initiation factor 2 subunit alpha [uncultured archaeon]
MPKEQADSYPDVGELIIGTVETIFNQGAFITLDEYQDKKGILPLREISLKWVRNIHDYVKKDQKVVLQVLRVDTEKGHIDLSLRRVTEAQKKEKLQLVKQKQRAEKLTEILAKEFGEDPAAILAELEEAFEEYPTLYEGFEAVAIDPSIVDKIKINPKKRKPLKEIIQKSIKPPFVEITGYAELKSYDGQGVKHLTEALKAIHDYVDPDCAVTISYISAPIYRVKVRGPDYKTSERVLKEAIEAGIKVIKEKNGEGTFHRELKQAAATS